MGVKQYKLYQLPKDEYLDRDDIIFVDACARNLLFMTDDLYHMVKWAPKTFARARPCMAHVRMHTGISVRTYFVPVPSVPCDHYLLYTTRHARYKKWLGRSMSRVFVIVRAATLNERKNSQDIQRNGEYIFRIDSCKSKLNLALKKLKVTVSVNF